MNLVSLTLLFLAIALIGFVSAEQFEVEADEEDGKIIKVQIKDTISTRETVNENQLTLQD